MMTFSDEQLSAFLDAELEEPEMEAIRQSLETNPMLTNRLAELAVADQLVQASYRKIDELALPEKVTELLQEDRRPGAQVIEFPWWRLAHQKVQQHAAVAACLALVLGFMAAQLIPPEDTSDWSKIANVLESGRSGVEQITPDGEKIKPQLTFASHEGKYCRQFKMQHKDKRTEQSVACRGDSGWQPVTRVYTEQQLDSGYQTAFGGSMLDNVIDQLIVNEPLDAAAESELIARKWSP